MRGAASDYVPIEAMVAIRPLFPTARLQTLSNAVHWVHAEQPGGIYQRSYRVLMCIAWLQSERLTLSVLRGIAWLRGLLLLSAIAVSGFADPVSADSFKTFRHTLSLEIAAGEYHMQAQLLGAIELPTTTINRIPLYGLSALAFDADQNLLYAGSDGGSLFHFQPGFEDGLLTELKVITAYRLHDPQGKPLRGDWADAEGMSARNADNGVRGDTVLTISFEREHRVEDYTPNGRWIRRYPLPRQLRQKQANGYLEKPVSLAFRGTLL